MIHHSKRFTDERLRRADRYGHVCSTTVRGSWRSTRYWRLILGCEFYNKGPRLPFHYRSRIQFISGV